MNTKTGSTTLSHLAPHGGWWPSYLHSYSQRLRAKRFPLVLHKAKAITSQSIEALSHLHLKAEAAHRDIKPVNIVVNESIYGITIKLHDFGLKPRRSQNPLPREQRSQHADEEMRPEVRPGTRTHTANAWRHPRPSHRHLVRHPLSQPAERK